MKKFMQKYKVFIFLMAVVICFAPALQTQAAVNYPDVNTGNWFYEYVNYVTENSLMTGYDNGTFGPEDQLTRGQFATILYRMSGSPEVTYDGSFPDVADGLFYSAGVTWANQSGVITGYENGNFGPEDNITREQIATILYRYAPTVGKDNTQTGDLSKFPDAGSVSSFAKAGMIYATGAGLITGDRGNLNPLGNATRAQCAAILMRFLEGAETTEDDTSDSGITAVTYNANGKYLSNVLPGVSHNSILNWLGQHRYDSYYLGTPYPQNADGTYILGKTGNTDRRNPNGDCGTAYGTDDYAGVAMMNCTGFVWHVLYKASGMSYADAWRSIPAWGGRGAGGWRTWLIKNGIEYRTYYSSDADDINALIHTVVNDGYIEPGDIIWTWDEDATYSDGLPVTSSDYHHIGIYTGSYFNGNDNNEWWNALGYSSYTDTYYGQTFVGNIIPGTSCVAITVIKAIDFEP